MKELAPLDCQEEVEISLINVDHPQTVDFIVSRVFEDHGVDDSLPSFKDIASCDAIIYEGYNGFCDAVLGVRQEIVFGVLGVFTIWGGFGIKPFSKEGLIPA